MDSCLIVAGEKSGEEHAMSFFPELRSLLPQAKFYGVGGDELQKNGMELIYHLKDFSSMGFSEVIHKIPFYFSALKRLENEVQKRGTKTAIVVDFQDFNMRLAARLKKIGVNVLYYVAPQAWAWKPHRAKALSKNVHTLFTILPFEKKWFQDRGVEQVRSIPHPLMLTYKDKLHDIPAKKFGSWSSQLKILVLPGSRKFEIYSLLPEFIQTVRALREQYEVEVHLVKVNHVSSDVYDYFKDDVDVWYDADEITQAMKICHFSLAASGTVTLATGLFELPTIVCYKASLLNEFIFYNFLDYQGPISLTNIIHGQMVFPEFTQQLVSAPNLVRIIKTWSQDENVYNDIKATLRKTKDLLSGEDFSVPEYMAKVIS